MGTAAWAQAITYGDLITRTYGKGNGTFYKIDGTIASSSNGGFTDVNKFVSSNTPAVTVLASGVGQLNASDDANVSRLGLNNGTNTFTISVPLGYVIDSYSFDCKAVQTGHPARTLTKESGGTVSVPTGNNTTWYSVSETNINKQSTYFTITTTGWSPINTRNFTIKLKPILYTVTEDVENLSEITDYTSFGSFNVPTGKTLNVDVDDFDLTKIHGAGTIAFNDATTITTSGIASDFTGTLNVNNASATVTISGNLGACTIKKTSGTLTYTGTNLNGTTLDGAILGGSARINTSGTVNIKDLAGNNISGSNGYAFVSSGSGTLNFEGTCDLTHKADGTTSNENAKIGYGSTNAINIMENATVTALQIMNSTSADSNAPVNVASGATLTTTTNIRSNSLTNNGTINATQLFGAVTLADGSVTTLSNATPLNKATSLTGTTVTGDATLNLTASTATLNQAITIADGKTLTIDGSSNTVSLAVTPTFGTGSIISFENATITKSFDGRSLANYTFTDCTATAQFVETTDEYKAGGFTITDIPSGVIIQVKKYGTADYETVTPVEGTATISHSVEVSGSAAWLDYTFNMSTKAANTHSPADQVIANAGNAGSGNDLTIDTGYNTDNSYNDNDGTLKVMSTPWRDIAWPTNYTVAVAGNVPDVENGCLVAFGSTTQGSKKYLAIIRGASQNEIKLVKGSEGNAFEVITTMTAANATALSHLVVFTKSGSTFTVYLDGVQKAQVEYSETLGGGFQIGSLHGGVTGTGIVRVNSMSDDAKAKVFAKTIRVYDYVISTDQMDQLKGEFPYVSFGGTYSRTISAAESDLSATSAWLNEGTQGYVNVPVNAEVDEVIYYPDVEITTTVASTLTVNANMDAENITFEGTGKLTIVSDGTHNIHIDGSVTANGPVSVKYGEIDLSAVPVSIGGSGSIEFDFSDYDFSDVFDETPFTVTGNTSDYGSKVTAVYPSDTENHTYTLAYNSATNQYVLTVEPTVALKQQQAKDIVDPYKDHIGTGVGKYTISLDETDYTDYDDFVDAVDGWDEVADYVEPSVSFNTVPEGFYRFKAAARSANDATYNWYMGGNASGIYSASTTAAQASDANTIFYLNNDADGYHLINYVSSLYSNGTANNAVGTSSNFTLTQAIKENNTDKLLGEYKLFNTGTSKTIVMWSNDVLNAIDGNNDWSGWTIEPVESLPVTITTAKWATLYSPVALTIPSETPAVKAYYISALTSTEATLSEITETIPANTPVILYANVEANTTYTFTITTADAFSGTNKLAGQIAAFSVSADDVTNKVYYTLQRNRAGTAVGLFPKTSAGSIAGFKAYLPAANFPSEEPSSIKGFTFVFDDDDDPTGIQTLSNSPLKGEDIYNLAGQRIQKMQKGINIVNGKKVLF